jgi:HK97 family phage portal protein
MTAFDLRRSMMMSALLYGNGICAINRTVGGELLELIPLAPDSVSLRVENGRAVYQTADYGTLATDQVLHVKAPGISGLWGDSPIALCRTSIQLLAAQEQMAMKAYTNAGNPKIAIVSPRQLNEELMQKVEDYYMKRHGGSANAGRPVVLGDGVRIERISSTIDDTGLEAARAYSIADVCRIYGVPASYLSEDVGSTYGTQEWLSRMYVDACLSPWIAAITAEVTAKLGGIGSRMSWDLDDLVRPGMAERMAALRTGVEAGIMTRNEAREELDLAPLPGLDDPIVALNMGTGGGQTNMGDDTSAGEGTPNDFTT